MEVGSLQLSERTSPLEEVDGVMQVVGVVVILSTFQITPQTREKKFSGFYDDQTA